MGGFWRRSPQKETELKLGIELTSRQTYNYGGGTVRPSYNYVEGHNKRYVRKPRSIIFYLLFPWLQFGYHGKRQPEKIFGPDHPMCRSSVENVTEVNSNE